MYLRGLIPVRGSLLSDIPRETITSKSSGHNFRMGCCILGIATVNGRVRERVSKAMSAFPEACYRLPGRVFAFLCLCGNKAITTGHWLTKGSNRGARIEEDISCSLMAFSRCADQEATRKPPEEHRTPTAILITGLISTQEEEIASGNRGDYAVADSAERSLNQVVV